MSEKPTVFIVDDDAAVRRFLRSLVSSVDLEVETFRTAQAFLAAFEPNKRGCILLDIRMPGMSGLELQRELRERGIFLPVIFLTGHGDVQIAVHAMKAGAADFIEKPFKNNQLLDRIQKAVAESLNTDQTRMKRDEVERRIASLTPREQQVLELVTLGKTNKSIAKQLAISKRTVEIHRAKVMDKMSAGSLAELVHMVAFLDFWRKGNPNAAPEWPGTLLLRGNR
jgi:two-component system, LuxR family, response regulator FixJ